MDSGGGMGVVVVVVSTGDTGLKANVFNTSIA